MMPLLQSAGIEAYQREARILLAHAAGVRPEDVFLNPNAEGTPSIEQCALDFVHRRLKGEPLSKIIERREFWSLSFRVTHDTLDPRPDSETLIEAVLENYPDRTKPLEFLDLGTGTGCLIITLLKEYPNARGIAVDLSFKAAQIAQENAVSLGVSDRLLIINGKWVEALRGSFDIIVSNPPYIGHEEILEDHVTSYDPALALFAQEEGYEHYQHFSDILGFYLASKGKIFLEFGYTQQKKVIYLFKKSGFMLIKSYMDINGIHRCACFSL